MVSTIPIKSFKQYRESINPYMISDFQTINLTINPKIQKILIIKWGGMGDVIIASGIINDVVASFPNAKIDINTLPEWQKLFSNHNGLNKIWGSKKKGGLNSVAHFLGWLKIVYAEKYDLIIDLQTNDRTRVYLSIMRLFNMAPKYIIGNHPVIPYTTKPKSKIKLTHPFHLMQRTINSIGVVSSTISPVIYSSQKDVQFANKLLESNSLDKDSYTVLICGSNIRGKLKRWGEKKFIDLSFLIIQKFQHKIVLVGGPDDSGACETIAKNNKAIINLCNQTRLTELPEIFSNAKFIVGNDTGLVHLAASTKTPMIVITGPTDPRLVKPLGRHIMAIQADIECKNCYQKLCSHHSCMVGLSAKEILKHIQKMI